MFITVIDQLVASLGDLLDGFDIDNSHWCLFTNDMTPGFGTVVGDLTEAVWTGYARQAYEDRISIDPASGVAVASYPPVIFVQASGGDQIVYGAFLVAGDAGVLVGCERFGSAPITIPDGIDFVYTPQQTLQNLP